MPQDLVRSNGDALQKRLARFVREPSEARSVGGYDAIRIATALGAMRHKNEDRAIVALGSYKATPQKNFALGAICDGIGGRPHGGDAAELAISVFVSRFLRTSKLAGPDRLRAAAMSANDAVFSFLVGRGGSTLSAVFLNDQGQALGVNVGDSRIYGISDGRELKLLSRDDTLGGLFGRTGGEQNQLVQFIGMGDGLEPNILTNSSVSSTEFLLTTDGVHGAPAEALEQVIRYARSADERVRRLMDLSEAVGGRDNATALTIPARPEIPDTGHEQGLRLEFLSASDHLEIWIPVSADDARPDYPYRILTEEERGSEKQNRKATRPTEQPANPRRRSRRRSKASQREDGSQRKNDVPPVEIQFPGKNEN